MADYIGDYPRQAAYFRELAAKTVGEQVVADLLYLARDLEQEASKLEEAFGLGAYAGQGSHIR